MDGNNSDSKHHFALAKPLLILVVILTAVFLYFNFLNKSDVSGVTGTPQMADKPFLLEGVVSKIEGENIYINIAKNSQKEVNGALLKDKILKVNAQTLFFKSGEEYNGPNGLSLIEVGSSLVAFTTVNPYKLNEVLYTKDQLPNQVLVKRIDVK